MISIDTLLQYKPKVKSDRTPLVLTYHPNLKPIHKIVKNLQHFFKTDLDTIFPLPPLISYRQPPNLHLLLTSDSSTINKKSFSTGTFLCNSSQCCLCPNIDSRSSITGPNGVSFNTVIPKVGASAPQGAFATFKGTLGTKWAIGGH